MAIYAVRRGNKTGKFNSWTECAKYVIGVSGAEYKKCKDEDEADKFLGIVKESKLTGLTQVVPITVNPIANAAKESNDIISSGKLADGEAVAYVDGSYSVGIKAFSFGCILVTSEGKKCISGMDFNSKLLRLQNVAGELVGAMVAVKTAKELGVSKLTIIHDYAGISNWVHGTWSAKSEVALAYKRYMQDNMKTMPVFFHWIKGHSGFKAGDKVDWLAKSALKNKTRCYTAKLFEGYLDFTEINEYKLSSLNLANKELVLA